ncbi:hypothetical protein [Thiolapillus sp.]|uniref:hypothetical protein n=1 Tax=Thiolapillus sp. TaxID=2017437 RepID=UPI003AF87349
MSAGYLSMQREFSPLGWLQLPPVELPMLLHDDNSHLYTNQPEDFDQFATCLLKYKEVNNNIKRCMKTAKENWIGEQCSEIEENLRKNNSKRAY